MIPWCFHPLVHIKNNFLDGLRREVVGADRLLQCRCCRQGVLRRDALCCHRESDRDRMLLGVWQRLCSACILKNIDFRVQYKQIAPIHLGLLLGWGGLARIHRARPDACFTHPPPSVAANTGSSAARITCREQPVKLQYRCLV